MLITGIFSGLLFGYLIGPFVFLPYMLTHLDKQPRPSFKVFTFLYGRVLGPSHDDPYNQVYRKFVVWQCELHPGACIDPPKQ